METLGFGQPCVALDFCAN